MKLVIILFITALFGCHVVGYLITIPKYILQTKPATNDWVHRQKLMLWLFEDICEDSVNPTIVRLANEFSFDSAANNYENSSIVANLQNLINRNAMTPKGSIFSEFNKDHVEELTTIYDFLYNAKGFDAFYNAAAWARQNTNCGIFIDAIYAAIFHRRDTEKIAIPPPYELLPNYFILKDFITKGIMIINNEENAISEDIHIEGNTCTIDANYTADLVENDDESKLAYFLEDIGLNTYYFFNKLIRNKWAKTNDYTSGEYWYNLLKQLITRYNLERYSNGFPEIEEFSMDDLTKMKYDSKLMYSNGYDIPARDGMENLEELTYMGIIEDNLNVFVNDLVTRGLNKSSILYNLMDLFVFGNNSYESHAINLLGSNNKSGMPSDLEHYMTMLRDPIYWKILKKITNLVEYALTYIPAVYDKNALYFPGVKVSDVLIKKMTTSFDTFTFDVTNAIKSNSSKRDIQMKISQARLGNKPFSIKINITSLVTKKGLIKVYLGSKMSPIESVKNLFLLDSFEYTFKIGTNIISRNTDQIHSISKDLLSVKTLYDNIEEAEFGLETMSLINVQSYANFPARLVIPKGSSGSDMLYQIMVFVAPFTKIKKNDTQSTEFNEAVLSPNYPFDLLRDSKMLYSLPNCMFRQIIITHKGIKKSEYKYKGDANEWSGNNYDPTAYDYTNKKQSGAFDYKAKKEKYGKNTATTPEFTTTTISNIILETTMDYDSMTEKDVPSIEKGNIENSLSNINVSDFKDENNQDEDITSFTYKRIPSVYDYIFHFPYNEDDDPTDDRVYE